MDKIWWNEQWMGELGPHYSASSNVDNAAKLEGKLMLVVGEMDTNMDPSSTFQVVNALIKANKAFDLLVIPVPGTRVAARMASESGTTSSSTTC
jgi:dipeptidyl aminopeptidase/acylaminoacyl peptidase